MINLSLETGTVADVLKEALLVPLLKKVNSDFAIQVFSNFRPVSNLMFTSKLIEKAAAHQLTSFIIHQTHYEKSDWSRAFNQFTIACELDMINVISAADITFIMSSSTSAWLLSPLECSPQKQNG